jgi:SsuE family FMN reductase
VAARVAGLLARSFEVETVAVRDLPAEDLLHGRAEAPEIARVIALVEAADAVVVTTPIYKASFSGLLKTLLDVLPQFALRGKSVLPVATGGATAHILALDYALRPVLMSMGAAHVAPAYVLLEQSLARAQSEQGGYVLSEDGALKLDEMTERFARVVSLGPLE